MSMRVIAGELRHRKLVYPENNPNIRPTKDRIREAFFSSLGDISEKSFLDLYAGCGAMGIEAISRGVSRAYFVDNNKESLHYIKENISSLNIVNKSTVLFMDDMVALSKFKQENIKFDIVYLDPPYLLGKYEKILSFIYSNNLLNENSVVALEANRSITIDTSWNVKIKEYHYGEISVIVLRK